MSDIKIEKDIPLSPFYLALYQKRGGGKNGRQTKYPFKEMLPGDSFVVPLAQTKNLTDFRQTANVYGRRYGMTFIVIRDDNHVLRCWRVT